MARRRFGIFGRGAEEGSGEPAADETTAEDFTPPPQSPPAAPSPRSDTEEWTAPQGQAAAPAAAPPDDADAEVLVPPELNSGDAPAARQRPVARASAPNRTRRVAGNGTLGSGSGAEDEVAERTRVAAESAAQEAEERAMEEILALEEA